MWIGKCGWSLFLGFMAATLAAAPEWELGEPVPEGPGRDFALTEGARFYLEVIDNRFFAVFIDEERRVIPPPVHRIILNGEGATPRVDRFNLPLSADSGPVLTHPRLFHAPHDFWLAVVVPREGSDDPVIIPRQRFQQTPQ